MTKANVGGDPAPAIRQRERPRPKTKAQVLAPSPISEKSYEVGYARPPKHTQFQPGQSGNPKGRPKGAKGFWAQLHEESQKMITYRENGRDVPITMQQAAIKRLYSEGISGKAMLKNLVSLLKEAALREATTSESRELSVEDQELVRSLMRGFGDE